MKHWHDLARMNAIGGEPTLDGRRKLLNHCFMIAGIYWLNIDYCTLFRLRHDGQIDRENDPDGSAGPRFCLPAAQMATSSGCEPIYPTIWRQSWKASPLPSRPSSTRRNRYERYLSLLDGDNPAAHNFGLIYVLPHAHLYPSDALLISSDSKEGQDLMQPWAANGVPESLFELGFREVTDFWTPWFAAVIVDEVASIAFAARLADTGAELGLVTVKAFRGLGPAATATAG